MPRKRSSSLARIRRPADPSATPSTKARPPVFGILVVALLFALSVGLGLRSSGAAQATDDRGLSRNAEIPLGLETGADGTDAGWQPFRPKSYPNPRPPDTRVPIADHITFSLHTDKRRYKLHELVQLTMQVTNKSDMTFEVAEPAIGHRTTWLTLQCPHSSRMIDQMWLNEKTDAPKSVELEPGESVSVAIRLEVGQSGPHAIDGSFRGVGRATGKKVQWKGSAKAQAVTFTVEPAGDSKKLLAEKMDRLLARARAEQARHPSWESLGPSLNQIKDVGVDATPYVIDAWRGEQNEHLRKRLLLLLSWMPSAEALGFYRECLTSDDAEMWKVTCWALHRLHEQGEAGSDEALNELLGLFDGDNPQLRDLAVRSLRRIYHSKVKERFERLTADTDAQLPLRERAARYLAAYEGTSLSQWLDRAAQGPTPAAFLGAQSIVRDLERRWHVSKGGLPAGPWAQVSTDPDRLQQLATTLRGWHEWTLENPRSASEFFTYDRQEWHEVARRMHDAAKVAYRPSAVAPLPIVKQQTPYDRFLFHRHYFHRHNAQAGVTETDSIVMAEVTPDGFVFKDVFTGNVGIGIPFLDVIDGRLYVDMRALVAIDIATGEAEELASNIYPYAYAEGKFYCWTPGTDKAELRLYDFNRQAERVVANTPERPDCGAMAVSPDHRWLVYFGRARSGPGPESSETVAINGHYFTLHLIDLSTGAHATPFGSTSYAFRGDRSYPPPLMWLDEHTVLFVRAARLEDGRWADNKLVTANVVTREVKDLVQLPGGVFPVDALYRPVVGSDVWVTRWLNPTYVDYRLDAATGKLAETDLLASLTGETREHPEWQLVFPAPDGRRLVWIAHKERGHYRKLIYHDRLESQRREMVEGWLGVSGLWFKSEQLEPRTKAEAAGVPREGSCARHLGQVPKGLPKAIEGDPVSRSEFAIPRRHREAVLPGTARSGGP